MFDIRTRRSDPAGFVFVSDRNDWMGNRAASCGHDLVERGHLKTIADSDGDVETVAGPHAQLGPIAESGGSMVLGGCHLQSYQRTGDQLIEGGKSLCLLLHVDLPRALFERQGLREFRHGPTAYME